MHRRVIDAQGDRSGWKRREQRTLDLDGSREEGRGVRRAADNGTREREDRTHIHVGPRGVDFSGFPRELVVTVLAASRPQGESLVASPPAEIYFRNTAAGPLPPIHRSLPVRVNISRRRARLETFRELALASRTGKRTGIRPVPAFFPRETLWREGILILFLPWPRHSVTGRTRGRNWGRNSFFLFLFFFFFSSSSSKIRRYEEGEEGMWG